MGSGETSGYRAEVWREPAGQRPRPSLRTLHHVDEILAQWRRERPDLNVAPLGLYGRLFRIDRLSDDALAKGLAPYGLQPGWFDLLAALRRAGTPYELNPTQPLLAPPLFYMS